MFGLGAWEVVVIMAVALIVLGPQKLPELAKQLARLMGELRRVADDVRSNFDEATRDIHPPPPPSSNLPLGSQLPQQPAWVPPEVPGMASAPPTDVPPHPAAGADHAASALDAAAPPIKPDPHD
jgi:Tat protein translocase TatB subunit